MLIGMIGRIDFWSGQLTEHDYRVIREARLELVKLMEYTRLNVLSRLRAEQPAIQFIIRLYEEGQKPGPPAEFVKKHANAIESFRPYVTLFEMLNEPNHVQEGWGPTQDQAKAFNRWFLETLPLLKARHPWARFGFPALSPTMLPNDPYLDFDWLEACRPAIEAADWLGVHCYWFDEHSVLHPSFGLRFIEYHNRFPNKTIHITEFNDSPQTHPWHRAQHYAEYYQEIAHYEYIASASAFIISSPDEQFHPLQWWQPHTGESQPVVWHVRNIPRPLGPKTDDRPRYAVQYLEHNTPDTMLLGQSVTVQVKLTNTSRKTWPEAGVNMVRLGYYWYKADGNVLPESLWVQNRARLPYDVRPGDRVTLHIPVEAPRLAGNYVLKWDMVEEFITWFAWEGVPTLNVPVTVNRDPVTPPAPLPEGQLRATASHNNVLQGVDNLQQALDKNPYTRWSTLQPQRPGMWFQLDLGRLQTVAQVQLDNANSPLDFPYGYVIKVSQNGQNWETVAENPHNREPLNVVFPARQVRLIRIEQTGSSDRWWWSIHEIQVSDQVRVTGRASHNNVLVGADNVLQALDGNVQTRWSTRTLQRPGQWFEVDLNATRTIKRIVLDNSNSPHDYPRGYVIRLSPDRQNWVEVARRDQNSGPVEVSFAPQAARFIRIEQIGNADRWWWSIHRIGVE
ncbi:MAG: discoidin domain-containing protein [Chloroflexota bacterium]